MATTLDFMQYIAEQMEQAEEITYRKLFGEYAIYRAGQLFALVCDNRLYFKPTEAGRLLLGTPILVSPYEGAKPYFYIEDVDNEELLVSLTLATCQELPFPKPKKNSR